VSIVLGGKRVVGGLSWEGKWPRRDGLEKIASEKWPRRSRAWARSGFLELVRVLGTRSGAWAPSVAL
jgi:hypothetical protein